MFSQGKDAIARVEGHNLILYNLVSEKFMEVDSMRTGKVDIYLFQKPDKDIKEINSGGVPLMNSFVPITYSETSNYLMELVLYTSGETPSAPYTSSYKSVNLREVINLRNALESGGKNKSLSESRVFYGDIRQLGLYLAYQVKSSNIMENQDTETNTEHQEKVGSYTTS